MPEKKDSERGASLPPVAPEALSEGARRMRICPQVAVAPSHVHALR